MEGKGLLMEMEEPLRRLTCGINAMELMVIGLGRARDPYADGIHMVWDHLILNFNKQL